MTDVFADPDTSYPAPTMLPAEQAAFDDSVARGLAQAKAGQLITGEDVAAWVNSWRTDHELPRPESTKKFSL
jgi:hypothetical protein